MSLIWCLGNDVVDLTSPRTRGKVHHRFFLHRVFNQEERDAIAASRTPEATLWALWAAKEAVFKSATKALGSPPIFHHPGYRISIPTEELELLASPSTSDLVTVQARGSYEELFFSVRIRKSPRFIQSLAWSADPGNREPEVIQGMARAAEMDEESSRDALRPHFSEAEWKCVSHPRSARTRKAAREALAKTLDVDEDRLEIRCGPGLPGRRVPLAYLDRELLEVDLTLSHDGPLMAWAFLPSRCPMEREG